MSGSRASSNETEKVGVEVPPDQEISDDSDEDESEILEESPCGRWVKRREECVQNSTWREPLVLDSSPEPFHFHSSVCFVCKR
ncbi:unnamed protein product [Orchesella dallaii]|uniref:Uncharacterized protein n=1 Tax=Orchesella dallaii TaxID=48710 RepID=A0ABP1QIF0_9HEXA